MFQLTNVIPERIIFVSRGITVQYFLCFLIFVNCICLAFTVIILCVYVYLICICCTLCVFVVLCVYCCFTLDARLLARSQYPEGPATSPLDTGFFWFPCVYKQMLRWFPSFQVATACFSCSSLDLNFLVMYLIFAYM